MTVSRSLVFSATSIFLLQYQLAKGVTCRDRTREVPSPPVVSAVNVWLGRTDGDGDVAGPIR